MIQATASALMNQFANNLKKQIGDSPAAPATAGAAPAQPASPPPEAAPISGFSLMARVIWDSILRLFGGRPQG
jgi:hypothetical protein